MNNLEINTNTTNYTNYTSQNASNPSDNGIMQKDDFLKLFLASLQYQDPMSPMETKDMMAQMSQLTMVEQITNLGKIVDNLKSVIEKNPLDQGVNYLGKEVSGISSEGNVVKGVVDEINIKNGILELMVGNKNISIGNITRVANYSNLNI